jgi:hypothetical protein
MCEMGKRSGSIVEQVTNSHHSGPAEAGYILTADQCLCKYFKKLDSGLRRNDEKNTLHTFYECTKFKRSTPCHQPASP